jgi:hypothetical protein
VAHHAYLEINGVKHELADRYDHESDLFQIRQTLEARLSSPSGDQLLRLPVLKNRARADLLVAGNRIVTAAVWLEETAEPQIF